MYEAEFRTFQKTGDRAALARAFDGVAPSLLMIAGQLHPSGVDPEDLVQTTFVRAIEVADRYDATRPLLPWLSGMLARVAFEARRRSLRGIDTHRLDRFRTPATPLDEAETRELGLALARVLEALPGHYRSVLVDRLVHGRSIAEIARNHNCAPATVKTRLARGKQLARHALPAGLSLGLVAVLRVRGLAAVRGRVLARARKRAVMRWSVRAAAVAAITAVLTASTVPLIRVDGGEQRAATDPKTEPVAAAGPEAPAPERRVAPVATTVIRGRIVGATEVSMRGARVLAYPGSATDAVQQRRRLWSVLDSGTVGGVAPLEVDGPPVATASVRDDRSFVLEGVEVGHYRLVLDHEFYAFVRPVAVSVGDARRPYDLGYLDAYCGGLVRGRFVGPRVSSDAVDLEVEPDPLDIVENPKRCLSLRLADGSKVAKLDAGGVFEFRAVWPASKVRITMAGGLAAADVFPLAAGDVRDVLVTVRPVGSLHVTVRNECGRGITGARVSIDGRERSRRTDEGGECDIAVMPAGRHRVTIAGPGRLSETREVVVPTASRRSLVVTLSAGASVSGRVLDQRGQAVAGAAIAVGVGDGFTAGRGSPEPVSVSGNDGSFRVSGILADGGTLRVTHAEYPPEVVRVRPRQTDLEVVLRDPATVSGRVRDRMTGLPVASFDVEIVERGPFSIERAIRRRAVRSASGGDFVLDRVPAGSFVLRVTAPGREPGVLPIQLTAGQHLRVETIALGPSAVVRGRVLGPTGAPVPGARVTLRAGRASTDPLEERSVLTDRLGRFELGDVASGRVTVVARASGFAPGRSKRLRIRPGDQREDVVVRLDAGGTIEGRLAVGVGRGTLGWRVVVHRAFVFDGRVADVGRDGAFRIPNLVPGRYEIEAIDTYDKDPAARTVLGRARVRRGETARVELDARDNVARGIELVGRVGLRGVARRSLVVMATRGDEPRPFATARVEDGRFRIPGLEPGVIHLWLYGDAGPLGLPHTVELPRGRTVEAVSWQLGTARLGGRVMTRQGTAVAGALVELALADRTAQCVCGPDGRFVFEGLEPGTYRARGESLDAQGARVLTIEPTDVRVREGGPSVELLAR